MASQVPCRRAHFLLDQAGETLTDVALLKTSSEIKWPVSVQGTVDLWSYIIVQVKNSDFLPNLAGRY